MAKRSAKKEDATSLKTALSLACLVLDYEAESSTVPEWRREVQEARQTITRALDRPDPGRFFVSPAHQPRKLRDNKQKKQL